MADSVDKGKVVLPTAEALARIQWDAEDHVHRGVRKQFDDMPDTLRLHRIRWAERVLAVLSGGSSG